MPTTLTHSIVPNLWFDTQAEEAAAFYCEVFPDSRIVTTARYTDAGPGEPGSVMTVEWELNGQKFLGINGGPQFTFSEAVSFLVTCDTQEEIDYYWDRLREGGGEEGPCGWLKDRFGLSWQIVPTVLPRLLSDPDQGRADRAMAAMLGMGKLDIQALTDAADAADAASGVASRPDSVGA